MKKIDIAKFVLFVLIVAAAVWAVEHYHLYRQLTTLKGWIQANGFYGAAIFVLIFGVVFAFGVPAIALSVFAGTIFGTFSGILAASLGATLGMAISFLLSRYLARDMVMDALGKNRTFIAIEAMTEKYGWYMVAIVRFIPFIPAELANYGFGLTRVKFLPYTLCSFACMVPWIFIYIAGTDSYLDYRIDGHIHWVLLASSVAMVLVLAFTAVMFMRRIEPELKERLKARRDEKDHGPQAPDGK